MLKLEKKNQNKSWGKYMKHNLGLTTASYDASHT